MVEEVQPASAQQELATPAAATAVAATMESAEARAAAAQEAIARGVAPVKLEYLRPRKATVLDLPAAAAPVAIQAKSRRQQKKDLRQNRAAELCHAFVQNRCNYGDKCKYSHDLAAYIQAKQADLPGVCPFSKAMDRCPFGVTCRWALSHTYSDTLQDQLKALPRASSQQQQEGAADGSQDIEGAGSADAGAAAAARRAALLSAYGLSEDQLVLSVAESMEKTINSLEKDVQTALWKHRYDFRRADAVLKELGIRTTFKQKQQGAANGADGGNKGGSKQQQPVDCADKATAVAAADTVMGESGADEAAAAAPQAAGAPAGGDNKDSAPVAAAEAEEPAAKRPRVDDGAASGSAGSARAMLEGIKAEQQQGTADAAAAKKAEALTEARAAHVETPLRACEKRTVDFRGKTYLAPLTTVGNLPFRRVCKQLGCDITIGEMAMATNLLQGQPSEWALLKRHPSEDIFGVQICGGYADTMARCAQLLGDHIDATFVDVNMGCPIDIVCDRSAGSALLRCPRRIEEIARSMSRSMDIPLTLKTRKGYNDGQDIAHTFLPKVASWGPIALTLHGRTRQQRYSRSADWDYIMQCGEGVADTGLQLIGNGDVFSYTDWNAHLNDVPGCPLASCMIGRGALIKPWLFTEIKEQRHWDISAGERLDIFKSFVSAGLEHWGSDNRGVETCRRFLLEWMSFTYRYIPVGLLEVIPQRMQHRPPRYYGRNDLETLLASDNAADWVRISEMLLGPAPANFAFSPKHKSNAYSSPAPAAAGGSSQQQQQAGGGEDDGADQG